MTLQNGNKEMCKLANFKAQKVTFNLLFKFEHISKMSPSKYAALYHNGFICDNNQDTLKKRTRKDLGITF